MCGFRSFFGKMALAGALLATVACDNEPAEPAKPETPTPVVEAPKPPEPVQTSVDLATLNSHPMWKPAAVALKNGKAEIASHPGSGGFSAQVPLPESSRKAGAGRVLVTIKVNEGAIQINATPEGDSTTLLSTWTLVKAEDSEATVEVRVPDLSKPTSLLFTNGSDTGQSMATVSKIDVVQP